MTEQEKAFYAALCEAIEIIKNAKDLEPEYVKIVSKQFWELLA